MGTADPASRLRARRWLGGAAVTVALLSALVLWLALVAAPRERGRFLDAARAQREAIVEDRAAAVETWLAAAIADARLLASYPTAVHLASRDSATPSSPGIGPRSHLESLLAGYLRLQTYATAAVFDRDLALVGAAPPTFLPGAGALDLARICMANSAPAVRVYQGSAGGPIVGIAAPIFDERSSARAVGVALLRTDPEAWLFPFLTHQLESSTTGSMILLQQDGERWQQVGIAAPDQAAPRRHDRDKEAASLAALAALGGGRSFTRYVDSDGRAVLVAFHSLRNAPWRLAARIEEREVLEPFDRWLLGSGAAVVALFLVFAAVAFAFRRREGERRALAVASSEARFTHLLEHANDAVLFLSPEGEIVRANRRAESLYGYPAAELVAMNVARLACREPGPGLSEALAAARVRGAVVLECEHLRRDGQRLPVEVSVSPAGEEMGNLSLAIVRDVSERRRAFERISRLNRLLHTRGEIKQLSARLASEEELLSAACRAIVELGGLAVVWVGRFDSPTGEIVAVASAGPTTHELKDLRIPSTSSGDRKLPTAEAFQTGHPVVVNDWKIEDAATRRPRWAREAGLHAVAAFPLDGGAYGRGTLSAYASETGVFDDEAVALLEEAVADLGFALAASETRRSLAHQDNLLRDMSRMARIGAWEFDPESGEGTWTDEVARIHGLEPGVPTSATIGLSFYTPESRARIDAAIAAALAHGTPYDLELELVTADGVRKCVRTVGVPEQREGRVITLRGTFQDITERKHAEQELARSRAHLQAALESMTDAVFISDSAGRFLELNDAFATFHRFASKEECRVTLAEYPELLGVFLPDGTPAPLERWAVPRALAGERATNQEYELVRKDTGERWTGSYAFAPIRDASNAIVGSVVVARDITEVQRAREALRLVNEQLEQRVAQRTTELAAANRELEAFAYSVSHDLRAPLRAIDGFAQVLVEEKAAELDAEGRRMLGIVRQGAQRMAQLIDDLLAFSRLGRAEIKRLRVDMRGLVESVFAEVIADAAPHRPEIVLGPLPPAHADLALIRQVWTNLLTNAVKFSGRRERPRIEVSGWSAAGEVHFEVADNGAGFDPLFQGRLFEVFQRLHNANEFPGTGVGLALVQRIVTRHGGRVWARGEVDRGATFGFSLPEDESLDAD